MYYKIQQVICIHAIILLYFEKKITDEFFEMALSQQMVDF